MNQKRKGFKYGMSPEDSRSPAAFIVLLMPIAIIGASVYYAGKAVGKRL